MPRGALALLCALLVAGCSDSTGTTAVNASCLLPAEAYLRALEAAPETVRLEGGAALSECVAGARSDGDLQTVGATLTEAAEELEVRAPRDPEAALRLGYLLGAARRGAQGQIGISDELVRRLARSADILDPTPAAARALGEGIAAGEARG